MKLRLFLILSIIAATFSCSLNIIADHIDGAIVGNYHYEENGIHYQFSIFENHSNYVLTKMWHDADIDLPEIIRLPKKITINTIYVNSETGLPINNQITIAEPYDIFLTNSAIDPALTVFNKIDIGKNRVVCEYGESNPPSFSVQSSGYEESGISEMGANTTVIDDVFYASIDWGPFDSQRTVCVALPQYANKTSLKLDDKTDVFKGNYTYSILRYPIYFPANADMTLDLSYYPFGSVEIPECISQKSVNIDFSRIKTFERGNVNGVTKADKLEAVVFNEAANLSAIADFYGNDALEHTLKFVELSIVEIPTINESLKDDLKKQIAEIGDDVVCITFVPAELYDSFKRLQSDGLFPRNTEIRVTEDFIYLSETLENGQWVEKDGIKKSQFLYAACRFGNAQIDKVEWSTSNESVTIDENGIVTILNNGESPNEAIITCTLIDQAGNQHTASRTIDINNPEWTDTGRNAYFDFGKSNFEYSHFENGIHYVFDVRQSNNFNFVSATLKKMWHDANVDVPEIVRLPDTIECILTPPAANGEKSECTPISFKIDDYNIQIDNVNIPDELKMFATIDLGKHRMYTDYTAGYPSLDLIAKQFIVNGKIEDVIIEAYISSHSYGDMDVLTAIPLLADYVNLDIDESFDTSEIKSGSNLQYLKYPIKQSNTGGVLSLNYYPFASYYDGALYIEHSKIKALCSPVRLPISNALELEAVKINNTGFFNHPYNYDCKDLTGIYNSSKRQGKLKYVELLSDNPNPEVYGYDANSIYDEKKVKEIISSVKDEEKIITFVDADQIETYRRLQNKGLFPLNADIRPKENMVYLCELLDRGQWVETGNAHSSQFIYAACCFGDSGITDVKWTSDHKRVCVDQDGVVTVTGLPTSGEDRIAKITCSITDNQGKTQIATRYIDLCGDWNDDSGIDKTNPDNRALVIGVYNLQGLKVADNIEKLPRGIYIVRSNNETKKVVVK